MTSCSTNECGIGGWGGPKPGDPDNNSVLSATAVFGGITVSWSYPGTNPQAVAHVLLYRSISNSFSSAIQIAIAGGNTYFDQVRPAQPTTYFYWIQIVSVNGTVGTAIGPASAATVSSIGEIIEELSGQIDSSVLAQSLRTEIDKITLNYSELTSEIANRIAGNEALSAALAQVQSGLEESLAFIDEEITIRQEGDAALVTQLNTVAAVNATNAAAILTEQTARVNADSALATSISTVATATGNNAAAITAETTARTNADSALANQITTAQTTLNGNIASVQTSLQSDINYVDGRVTSIGALYTAKVSVNGLVGGFGIYNNGTTIDAGFDVDTFWVGKTQANKRKPFIISGGVTYIDSAAIQDATITSAKIANATITSAKIQDASITSAKIAELFVNKLTGDVNKIVAVTGDYGGGGLGPDNWVTVSSAVLPASSHPDGHVPSGIITLYMSKGGSGSGAIRLLIDGAQVGETHSYMNSVATLVVAGAAGKTTSAVTFTLQATGTAGSTVYAGQIRGYIMGVR